MHNRATEPNDYEEGPRFGPGIVVRSENFGPAPMDAEPDDLFARRQDAIQHLNTAVAEADAIAAQALQDQRARFFDEGGATDFAARQRELLKGLRKEALKNAPDSSARDDLGAAFDRLSDRHLRGAVMVEHEARVRARAQGAERALERFKAAALVDPDDFADRIAEADALLSRLVEAGTDPLAAAERAHSFRLEMGQAVLDDLAERDPAGALARLDQGAFNDAFDEEGRADARSALLRVIEADREAAESRSIFAATKAKLERAARRRETIKALGAGLRDGTVNQGHIARTLYRGELEDSDAERLQAQLAELTTERLRREDAIDRFDQVINSETAGIMPGGWMQPDIDIWVEREIKRGRFPPHIIAKAIRIAGGVPEPYVDDVRRRLLSASPENVVAAGREFRELRRAAPASAEVVLANLPAPEARDLALYADYAHLDLPPERVSELVEDEQHRRDAIETKGSETDDREIPIEPVPTVERPDNVGDEGNRQPQTPDERGDAFQMFAAVGDDDADEPQLADDSVSEELAENDLAEALNNDAALPPPPTNEPVDLDEMYRQLGYDPNGTSESDVGLTSLSGIWGSTIGLYTLGLADHVRAREELSDAEKDAFQHAYWSYQ